MDLEKLAALGKDIGLSGKALQDFIVEQQQVARDQRAQERDLIAQRRELSECELRVEKLRVDRLQDGSEKELIQMKYDTEKIKRENIEHGNHNDTGSGNVVHSKHTRSPKLIVFQEGKDDMDAFILRFERYAVAQGWNRESEWAVNLGALLSGKGLHEYASMSATDANNYGKLKEAVLRAYQMTEDGFRQKLRSAKPRTGETGTTYATRLANYLDRWVEMSKVER